MEFIFRTYALLNINTGLSVRVWDLALDMTMLANLQRLRFGTGWPPVGSANKPIVWTMLFLPHASERCGFFCCFALPVERTRQSYHIFGVRMNSLIRLDQNFSCSHHPVLSILCSCNGVVGCMPGPGVRLGGCVNKTNQNPKLGSVCYGPRHRSRQQTIYGPECVCVGVRVKNWFVAPSGRWAESFIS